MSIECLRLRKAKTPVVAIVALLVSAGFGTEVFSQTPFYEGKTLRIVQARRPGGTGDMRTRAIARLLPKYIPGNPNILFEYMPGGGGTKAANYIYDGAKPDGLTIANSGSGVIGGAILGAPGVNYDFEKLVYLGSGNSKSSYVFVTRKQAGFDSLEKLIQAERVRIGGLSVGHTIYVNARIFAWLLRIQNPIFIPGYSGPELDQAVIAGEVDARVNIPDTVVQRTPHWIKENLVDFHSVFEIPPGFRMNHPAFTGLPTLQSFAKTEIDRKILGMARTFRLIGSPYMVGPGVPPERVKMLRDAFYQVFKDPELGPIWEQLTGQPASPLLPDEQDQAIRELPRDAEVIETYKRIAGAGPLPAH